MAASRTELNPEQRAAAEHRDGPMLVLAGAGCGKTAALVARYANLLGAGIEPERMLAITFTRRAARHMAGRIAHATGVDRERTAVGTFHSVALAIMRNYPQAFGRAASRRVIGEAEAERMIAEAAAELETSSDGMADAVGRHKDELRSSSDVLRDARSKRGTERREAERRARVYARYQKRLEEREAMDFGDILFAVVSALETDDKLRRTLRRRYRYVMVDEYQDINPAQNRMIELVAGKGGNVWAVGDPNQAIYGFRGSDVGYIERFPDVHPGTRTIRLFRNYRSAGPVVRAASAIAAKPGAAPGVGDAAVRGGADPVEIREEASPQDEADWIARRIERAAAAGEPYRDVAVLVRVAHHAAWIERALSARGIPFTLLGVSNFWSQPEVRQVIRVLATVHDGVEAPDDAPPPRRVMDELRARDRELPFADLGARVCRLVARHPRKDVTGQRREAWNAAMNVLANEFGRMEGPADLAERVDAGRTPDGHGGRGGGVAVGTIHSAKGLEWGTVVLAACEEGIVPHAKAEDVEEERRVAFVAVTRARDRFVATWSRERARGDMEPSRYLDEIRRNLGGGLVSVSAA